MPNHVREVLVHAMSGTELSRVRTEFRLRPPKPINQSHSSRGGADIVTQSSSFLGRNHVFLTARIPSFIELKQWSIAATSWQAFRHSLIQFIASEGRQERLTARTTGRPIIRGFTLLFTENARMESPDRQKDLAIAAVSQQSTALEELLSRAQAIGDTQLGFEQLRRWKDETIQILAEDVSENESRKLSEKRLGAFMMGQPLRNLLTEGNLYRAFLLALLDELQKRPERIVRLNPFRTHSAPVEIPAPIASPTVFLIHGHDELNLLRLSKLLKDQWNLDSLVLKEKAGKGRTLIEKFEEEAPAATFAIALLSPDDLVQGSGSPYLQARPNVVFELGWFYGRLGRERVCILKRVDTKLHSDLDGISRIDFKESVEEVVTEIEKELTTAEII
jgi:Predicted nucleotide-binding protein containing TIR-like domain